MNTILDLAKRSVYLDLHKQVSYIALGMVLIMLSCIKWNVHYGFVSEI